LATRKLTRQGKARRDRLIAEAALLFATNGYDATRVIDIVRSAGVAKGLFYWYFDNKEALFRDIVTSTREDLRRVQARAIENEDNPLARVAAGIEASLRFFAAKEHLHVLLLYAGTQERFAPLIDEAQDIHTADTAAHVAAAMEEGLIPPGDPMLLAHGVVALVLHFARLRASGRVAMPLDELCTFASTYCLRALGALGTVGAVGAPAPAHAG
jgi:AcrR family transcriptional regulator